MRVIGIDPGLAAVGYGVVERTSGNAYRYVDSGTIRTYPGQRSGERLAAIRDAVAGLVGEHRPQAAMVEELFFGRNTSSALPVAQARGVILCTLSTLGVEVIEIKPAAIKQIITGNGRSTKAEVRTMVELLLDGGLPADNGERYTDHAIDALAMGMAFAPIMLETCSIV